MMNLYYKHPRRIRSQCHRHYTLPKMHDVSIDGLLPFIQKHLSSWYWTPKFHKNPYKQRHLPGSSKCVSPNLFLNFWLLYLQLSKRVSSPTTTLVTPVVVLIQFGSWKKSKDLQEIFNSIFLFLVLKISTQKHLQRGVTQETVHLDTYM